MDIEFSSNFLKKAKKLPKREKELLSRKVELFREAPNDQRLRTHPLTGRLKGLYSFSLTYSKRVVFLYAGKNKTLFIDVGTHDEVYRQ